MMVPSSDRVSTLVIGYGNELRGDDGLGPHLAAAVEARGWPGVRTLVVHQLAPELVEEMAEVRRVIFVDARVASGGETVRVGRLRPWTAANGTTHCFGPRYLLTLVEILHQRSLEAWSITVEAESFQIGDSLSDAIRLHIPVALERIRALVQGQASLD